MTKVANIREEAYDVYIGRPGKGNPGPWGNPIKLTETCPLCQQVHSLGGDTLPCYAAYLEYKLEHDKEFLFEFLKLKGKTLGCFCKPNPCHGDIMADFLDNHV